MSPPLALVSSLIPPSGISHALFLPFTHSVNHPLPTPPRTVYSYSPAVIPGRVITNLILARGRRINLFEVREEQVDSELGGGVQASTSVNGSNTQPRTTLRLRHVASHTAYGHVTGLGALQTLSTKEDGLSRLVLSFAEAKMAILEWSDATYSFSTVSLHTYERTPQVSGADPDTEHNPLLRTDPDSRCAVLLLPGDALAVLPIMGGMLHDEDLGFEIEGGKNRREIPYLPSYVMEFMELDPQIRHVKDIVFLPGFHSPTLAVLYEILPSWSNRLLQDKPTTTLSMHSLSLSSTSSSSTSIAMIPNLPSSCSALFACPPSIPGVLILSPNMLIHVDPSGNTIEWTANRFAGYEGLRGAEGQGWEGLYRVWGTIGEDNGSEEKEGHEGEASGLRLEGSRVVWLEQADGSTATGDVEALLISKEGEVRKIVFEKEGRMLARMKVLKDVLGVGPIPAEALCVSLGSGSSSSGKPDSGESALFVGGLQGDSVLYRLGKESAVGNNPTQPEIESSINSVKTENGQEEIEGEKEEEGEEEDGDDMDVTEDLYGPSSPKKPRNAHLTTATTASLDTNLLSSLYTSAFGDSAGSGGKNERLRFEVCDTLKNHGTILGMTFGTEVGEHAPNDPQLLALGGSGHTASFNTFYKDMPAMLRRKPNAISGARGIWSINVTVPVPAATRGKGAASAIKDTVLVVDEDHKSGHTKIFNSFPLKGDPVTARRIPSATLAVGEFFNRARFVHVTNSSLSVLEGGGRERYSVRAPDDTSFLSATVADPYVLVHLENGSVHLYAGDPTTETLNRIQADFKGEDCVASSVFTDSTGIFSYRLRVKSSPTAESADQMDDDDENLYAEVEEAKPAAVVAAPEAAKRPTQWALLCFADGTIQVRSLPEFNVVFSSGDLANFPLILNNKAGKPRTGEEVSLTSSPPAIQQVLVAPVGTFSPQPYLLFLTTTGQLIIYHIVLAYTLPPSNTSADPLPIRFSKVISRALLPPNINSLAPWSLVPFARLSGRTGVFLTGEFPLWIVAGEHASIVLHTVDEKVVHAFAASPAFGGHGDRFLLSTGEGPKVLEFPKNIDISQPLPTKRVSPGRTYSHVVFDPTSCHAVAAGLFSVKYVLFDEDDQKVRSKTVDARLMPMTERSSLELLKFSSGEVMDGYEFADNETVLSLSSVNLETKSCPSGRKDYIAVGTGISRGEDLAERGATYIFEVAEIVADPARPQHQHRLKLLCRDDSKGAVTAVAEINGYLVSSMAQKLFVKAFDFEDRLLGLAFLDVSIYVTIISTFKNIIMIGDAVRSISLLAFQEEPFKLALISRDFKRRQIISADFFTAHGELGFIISDPKGDLRTLEFDPNDAEAEGGQKLILRSEYHHGSELSSVLTVARRTNEQELIAPQTQLLLGCHDGSISTMIPIDDDVYKRIQLLQSSMLRNIQHFGGLNPRAFHTVRNDSISRPLLKGILDGDLIFNVFSLLPRNQQEKITQQIGTSVEVVLEDLEELRAVW
ncbi:mRNA cleavage and polyadenylation factor II complex, subunit CFT1 (CPSF subunit) [Phaffia rhodozyma]|uniref:mRNA cleavage and polyadenylation factor II complex, subunit CFT1 (CPSF subunit) n=1 Tax=Phaffia rhodozyma TaxID=264483 RepID=A0A0F7SNX2_PHARH|nr:mRNA cleavage and polyadenylation factor II complex, subunit CFT1 (CPSF subunit) [Phaffia rhodozyma]